MAVIYGVLEADEDAGGDTDDEDETEDDERGDKYEDKQAVIIFWIPGKFNLYLSKC